MAGGIRAGGGGSAGRLSIDIVAEVARLDADMAKIRRIVKDASGDIARNAKAANDNLAGMSSGMKAVNDNMGKTAPSAKMAAFGMKNLAFQAQDLGVQLAAAAGSSDPLRMTLMAFVQQGPQIRDAINQTGKSVFQLAAGFATAHPVLLLLTAAVGVAYGAIALFAGEIDKSGELDRYASSLGLTKEEMKKLGDVSVTTGDVFKGLWRTIDQGLGASKIFAAIKSWAIDAFKGALTWATNFAAGAYAAIAGTVKIIGTLATAAKQVLQGDFAGALTTVVTGRMMDAYATAFGEAKKVMAGFGADVARNTIDVAKERIGAKAAEIIDDRAQKKMKDKAKETGSLLGDVMSGAFLANFAAKMAAHPFAKVDWGGPTDLRDRMSEIEDGEAAKRRLEESEDYMDQRSRERFTRAAREFADIAGGGIGRAVSGMMSVFDRLPKELRTQIAGVFDGFGTSLGSILKNAGIGGAAAAATGGSGIGGMAGGAIGGKLGEQFLSKGLASIAPMLGQFAGPIGAIAGGILGGVVGGLFKKVKKASATVEIMAGDAMQTSLTGNSAKLKAVAGQMADGLISGLLGIADQLGGMLGDGIKISIGKRKDTFRVDLQGLGRTKNMPSFDTEEEAISFAIQEVIRQGAIIGLRAGTETLLKGEGDLQTQLQKALKFENVFKDLAQRANPTIAALNAITKEFDDLIDVFAEARASTEDYAKLQELMAIKQREVIEQAFEPIRSLLDDLKGRVDTAAEAVRGAYQTVLDRETAAIQAYEDAVAAQQDTVRAQLEMTRGLAEKAATEARDAVEAAQKSYDDAVKRAADAAREATITGLQGTIDTIRSGITSLRDQANGFADAAGKLKDFVKSLNTDLGGGSLAELRTEFERIGAAAQGGDLAALGALPEIGARYRDAVTASATDRMSMMREIARISSVAGLAAGVADDRKGAVDAQIIAAEAQAAAAEQQLAALRSIDETALSVDDALKLLQTAKQAAALAEAQLAVFEPVATAAPNIEQLLRDMQDATAAADLGREQMGKLDLLTETEVSFADAVATYEKAKADRDDLIRQITEAGFADLITVQQQTGSQMVSALSAAAQAAAKASADASAAISAAQAAQASADLKAANDNGIASLFNGVPFFAGGGIHAGGLRVVGEYGPELEATGPSRIWNARQMATAVGGEGSGDVVEELRAMRAELEQLRAENNAGNSAIIEKTGKTYGVLDRVTRESGGDAITMTEAA